MFSTIFNRKKVTIKNKNLDDIIIKDDKLDDINYLETILKKLEKSIINLDNNINYQKPDHRMISDRLYYIKKLKIFLGINFYKLKNNSKYQKSIKLDNLIKKLDYIKKNIDLIDDFNTQLSDKRRNSSLDTLTRVNTIFLPLTLIVGYFGMNFPIPRLLDREQLLRFWRFLQIHFHLTLVVHLQRKAYLGLNFQRMPLYQYS